MLDVCFDRAQGGFQPCSSYVLTDLRYVSTMHEVYFDCRSKDASTVLEMCFNRARGIFRPSLVVCFDRRAQFVSTMLEICLRQCSGYASTVDKVCFDLARGRF